MLLPGPSCIPGCAPGALAAAGRIVNAIPDVMKAAPGIRTTLDLPLGTGKGTYRPA